MIVTTGNEVAGCGIDEYLGIVRGIVVRSPSIAQGFFGGLKSLVGGNIASYAQVCETAREDAYRLMLDQARHRGADAIIGMRYDATEFASGVTEVLAYGTAVTLTREGKPMRSTDVRAPTR
ncbi:MAG: YbjQ family protein [Gemmataceae bacterium]|nr:YbjQ family protein [Gemmataceae bacterium]